MGWVVNATPQRALPPGKDQVPIVKKAGFAPGPVRMGVENFVSTGIRSPDRPASSELLYQLRSPSPY